MVLDTASTIVQQPTIGPQSPYSTVGIPCRRAGDVGPAGALVQCVQEPNRSEGFSERDNWFLGTMDWGPAKWPEFSGRRRRRRPPARNFSSSVMDIEVHNIRWDRQRWTLRSNNRPWDRPKWTLRSKISCWKIEKSILRSNN